MYTLPTCQWIVTLSNKPLHHYCHLCHCCTLRTSTEWK